MVRKQVYKMHELTESNQIREPTAYNHHRQPEINDKEKIGDWYSRQTTASLLKGNQH
jgi:hypothetical protein